MVGEEAKGLHTPQNSALTKRVSRISFRDHDYAIFTSCIPCRILNSKPPNGQDASQECTTSPSGRLPIERRGERNGATVLSISGELDLESAPTLSRVLEDCDRASVDVVLDLSGLEFIDSTGIGVLVQARLRAGHDDRKLILTNLPRSVDRLFDIPGSRRDSRSARRSVARVQVGRGGCTRDPDFGVTTGPRPSHRHRDQVLAVGRHQLIRGWEP